jgi:rare lipoprotein A (peptidoglycan hydrolase)
MAKFVVVAGLTLAGVFGQVIEHKQHHAVHAHRHAAPKPPPMQYAVASWYYDAGETASGFHATYGVASKTLPFGTKVMFTYHGRTVEAIVDDRGPFVYGRTFDLNQTLAGALGFAGVDVVGYRIV